MKKIPEGVRVEEGRALARLGDGGWDPLVRQGRRDGRFADELVEAAAEAVRSWGAPVAWVTAVPSRRSGELVPDFARRLAERLGLPYAPVLERVGDNPPQREMANSQQQVANVRGQFAVTGDAAGGALPARRRHPLQRLDARDGRRPAARSRRRAGLPARALDRVLVLSERRAGESRAGERPDAGCRATRRLLDVRPGCRRQPEPSAPAPQGARAQLPR